ncbi:MAG: hypothetical protein WCO00_10860 [Rhodospirillaceae bacterium]
MNSALARGYSSPVLGASREPSTGPVARGRACFASAGGWVVSL